MSFFLIAHGFYFTHGLTFDEHKICWQKRRQRHLLKKDVHCLLAKGFSQPEQIGSMRPWLHQKSILVTDTWIIAQKILRQIDQPHLVDYNACKSWKNMGTEPHRHSSEFGRLVFEHSLYSHAPNTGRPVWQTRRKSVRLSNVRISNVQTSNYIMSGYRSINRTSDNRT